MALTKEQAIRALSGLVGVAEELRLDAQADVVGGLLVGVARGDLQARPSEHGLLEIADGIEQAAYAIVAILAANRGGAEAWHTPPLGGEDHCVVCWAPTRWCSRCSACLELQEVAHDVLAEHRGGLSLENLRAAVARYARPQTRNGQPVLVDVFAAMAIGDLRDRGALGGSDRRIVRPKRDA